MTKFAIAATIFCVLAAALATPIQAGPLGQTAVGKCVDSVVAACNKNKNDSAVNPCIDNGISQCEKEHSAQIRTPRPVRSQATGLVSPNR